MSLSDVLGGFGSGTKVQALGKEWTFIFDVPAMAAGMEEMCKKWHRLRYEADLKELPERNIPGSFDDRQAVRLFEEYRNDLRSGACAVANGRVGGGRVYQEWVKTTEGKLAGLLAALQIRHPEATMQTLADITNAAPDQIQAIVTDLGNAMRDAVPKLAASLQNSNPEVAAFLREKATEMEAISTGSPA